jgi:hypothetical protein
MPEKPLPHELVERLTKASDIISKRLGTMKNVDHRKNWQYWPQPDNPDFNSRGEGKRVREFNAKKNFPETNVVIKRDNEFSPSDTIEKISRIVQLHNSRHEGKTALILRFFGLKQKLPYELRQPFAYDIGHGLIAMAKTESPSLDEIIWLEESQTPRGKSRFNELQKQHGFTFEDLRKAANLARINSLIPTKHLLLTGYEME